MITRPHRFARMNINDVVANNTFKENNREVQPDDVQTLGAKRNPPEMFANGIRFFVVSYVQAANEPGVVRQKFHAAFATAEEAREYVLGKYKRFERRIPCEIIEGGVWATAIVPPAQRQTEYTNVVYEDPNLHKIMRDIITKQKDNEHEVAQRARQIDKNAKKVRAQAEKEAFEKMKAARLQIEAERKKQEQEALQASPAAASAESASASGKSEIVSASVTETTDTKVQ